MNFDIAAFRQTRVYQEAFEEGRERTLLQSIPRLFASGLTAEQIAEAFELEIAEVEEVLKKGPPKS